MKRIFAIALSLGIAARLPAVDLGGEFVMTNLGFPWARSQPIPADSSFPATDFLYGGSASVGQAISDNIRLETAYSLDPLQRSVFQATVNYDTGVLHIGIGPSFGIFNNGNYPMEAGIASSVRLDLPGLVFASFRNNSSLGSSLGSVGENSQGFNEISVGWYVKNAICTASMSSASFHVRQDANLVTGDSMTDYTFLIDIFKKNQPFNVKVSMGYRAVSKEFLYDGGSVKESLGIIVLGTKFVLRPASFLELALGLESGVYCFGFDSLLGRGPDPDSAFMFRANAGFVIKTDKFPTSNGIVVERGDSQAKAAPAADAEAATQAAPGEGEKAVDAGSDAAGGDK
jgi:hypothetical protein